MKKRVIILTIIIALGYFFLIQRVTVNAGEEAVIIKKPWFWGNKGVNKKVIKEGTIWSVASTEIKLISLKAFNIEESFTELFTSDNIPMELKLTLTFQNQKESGVILVKKFGDSEEWYKNLLLNPLQNSLETEIQKQTFKEMTQNSDTLKEIKSNILFGINDFLQKQSIPVELLDITFGKIVPPKEIVQMAIDGEVQKEKLKVQKLRKKVQEANALADRAYMLKMNMSPREYLKIKQIELERQKLSLQRFAIENAKESNGSIIIDIKMEKL